MGDRRPLAFEKNALPPKLIKELFVRNSQRRLEFKHVCKQLDKDKKDYKEGFEKTRSELLQQQLHRRRCSLPSFGTTNLQQTGGFVSHEMRGYEAVLGQSSPTKYATRSNHPFCSKPCLRVCPDIKPESERKIRSLSEILPPVSLPPIYLQGVQDRRISLKTSKSHREMDTNGVRQKVPGETDCRAIIRGETSKSLADCRYLRGDFHG